MRTARSAALGALVGVAAYLSAPHMHVAPFGPRSAQADEITPAQKAKLAEVKRLYAQVSKAIDEHREKDALALQLRMIAVIESLVGVDDPGLAEPVEFLGVIYHALHDLPHAEAAYRRALAIRERTAPGSKELAGTLRLLATALDARGEKAAARPLFERALAIYDKTLSPDDPTIADTLNDLGSLVAVLRDPSAAVASLERALAIDDKIGAPDAKTVSVVINLASAYEALGDYAHALPLCKRALAIHEKTLAPDDPQLARTLNNLADVYESLGDYARAEPLLLRSLAIREKTLGPNDPAVAIALNNLAHLYDAAGAYPRSEPLYARALSIREAAFGAAHPDVAELLNNIAAHYARRGDRARAIPLALRALAIYEKTPGPESREVAWTLQNLAVMYTQGTADPADFARAAPLAARSLAIYAKVLGAEHPSLATVLANTAQMYLVAHDVEHAAPLLARALAIREKALGPEHPDVAATLNSIATMHLVNKEPSRVLPLNERALAIYEKALGPNHPEVARTLDLIAMRREHAGAHGPALDAEERALDVREKNLDAILASGSEAQKLAYAQTLEDETDTAISMHTRAQPHDARAARLALTTVLRRKGRVLDAVSAGVSALREHLAPRDRALLDELTATRVRLAAATLTQARAGDPAARGAEIARLQTDVERVEAALGARSAEFRARTTAVTIEGVQAKLPADAALVEIASYDPLDFRILAQDGATGARRYVAYVLHHEGAPRWTDLGDAATIDARANAMRAVLANPSQPSVQAAARAVDELVMQPIRALLGGSRRVFVSPDGTLDLVPFEAMVDERGEYLVSRLSFTYFTSGRDLLRVDVARESESPPLILANPDFGAAAPSDARGGGGARGLAFDFTRAKFPPLPGTEGEATALAAILRDATVLRGEHATKRALVSAHAPRILHVATHGFFLAETPDAGSRGSRGLVLDSDASHATAIPNELTPAIAPKASSVNALLRSGLALAGANLHADEEPGILTAMEASGLDLIGTKLVVLSACETAVGEVKNGAGVYGLRRALVVAGSESQVMSLWKVDDEATRDLMTSFYAEVARGGGRTEALRRAKLAMLASPKRAHPYFWAAFIGSGDWRALDGRDVPLRDAAPLAKVSGCGCRAVGAVRGADTGIDGLVGAFGLLALLGVARARSSRGARATEVLRRRHAAVTRSR